MSTLSPPRTAQNSPPGTAENSPPGTAQNGPPGTAENTSDSGTDATVRTAEHAAGQAVAEPPVATRHRLAADGLLILTAVLWGSNLLVFKGTIGEFDPWVFNGLRLVFAAVTLGTLAWLEARFWPPALSSHAVPWGRVVAFSFLSGFLYLFVFVLGIDRTTVGNTALIFASMPMWTAILSFFLLRERLPRITWLGLLVTFAGTATVTTQGSGEVSLDSRYFLGNLFILAASMAWAGGTVISRSILDTLSPLRLAFISCALTTPFHLLLAASALPDALPQALQPMTLFAIIFSGVFSTGVAYVTWHAGVRAVGASHAAVYQNVVTLVAVLGGWIVLREQPLVAQVFGGLLTILGLYLMRRGRQG